MCLEQQRDETDPEAADKQLEWHGERTPQTGMGASWYT